MLSNSQIHKVSKYYLDLPDCEERDLFFKLISEYEDYKKCGTPEECMQRKEWMSMPIDDIRKGFNSFINEMKKEVEIIRAGSRVNDAASKIKRGRGRPKKIKED